MMVGTLVEEHRETAVYIAGYIGLFNMAEALVHAAFERAMGGDGTDSFILLGHIQSVSTRIRVVEDFIRHRKARLPWAEKLLPLFDPLRQAVSFRNRLAHGTYATAGDQMEVIDNLWAKNKRTSIAVLTSDEVKAEYERLGYLVFDIQKALGVAPQGPRGFMHRYKNLDK